MRVLERFQSWNRVRVAINRVEYENNPAAAAELLRKHPAESGRLADRATAMADGGAPWHALLLAVALARHGASQAVDLLRRLVGRDFPGWQRLNEEALRGLQAYLLDRGESRLLDAVRQRLHERQLVWVLPDVSADDFLEALARVDGERVVDEVVRRIAEFVEEVKLGERPASRGLDNAVRGAAILWDRGRVEEALQLWALVTVAEPAMFEGLELLRPVAEALPGWIPRRGSLRIEGLSEGFGVDASSLPLPSVPARVVRAADLLADLPHADWVEPLRRAWLAIDDLVRRDPSDEQHERDPSRLMAAQSIAAALGTCAALDRQMRALVRDEAARRRRYEALGGEVDQRNQLVEEYHRLVDRYHVGENVVEAIRNLRDEIGERDWTIARAREALRKT